MAQRATRTKASLPGAWATPCHSLNLKQAWCLSSLSSSLGSLEAPRGKHMPSSPWRTAARAAEPACQAQEDPCKVRLWLPCIRAAQERNSHARQLIAIRTRTSELTLSYFIYESRLASGRHQSYTLQMFTTWTTSFFPDVAYSRLHWYQHHLPEMLLLKSLTTGVILSSWCAWDSPSLHLLSLYDTHSNPIILKRVLIWSINEMIFLLYPDCKASASIFIQ